jgi:hypothetical protein
VSDGAKVVPLFSKTGDRDAPVTAKPRDPLTPRSRECKHREIEVDPNHRRVVCKSCGEVVDPIDSLQMLAADFDRYSKAREAAEREARLAQHRVDDLHREERNAKARLRRMRAQDRDLKNKLTRLDAELRSFTT